LGAWIGGVFLAPFLPMIIALPLTIVLCALAGAAWAFIPGYLQAKRGSHIVITTIMFNFLAFNLMVWLLGGPIKEAGQDNSHSERLVEATYMMPMHEFLGLFGFQLASTPFNISFLLALLAAVVYYIIVWRTRLGYEIRAVGKNQDAARYAGIDVARVIIIALLLSGAFAGLLATNEVMGAQHRVTNGFSAGYGFTGIAVALMGRNHPIGIVLAAFLFGALVQGGTELDFVYKSIDRNMVLLIQGMIILFSGALTYMWVGPLSRRLNRQVD